jgi:ribonuclease T1
MPRWRLALLSLALAVVACGPPATTSAEPAAPPPADEMKLPEGVPAKVGKVLAHIDKHGKAPEGYQGGRSFLNIEKLLPEKDANGKRIRYREWDVNPLRPGVNRGAERLVTGSDDSAYYTDDHYRSFTRIR